MPDVSVGVHLPGEDALIAWARMGEARAPVDLEFVKLLALIVEKMPQAQVESLAKLVESWASLAEKQLVPAHFVQDWINAQLAVLAKKQEG